MILCDTNILLELFTLNERDFHFIPGLRLHAIPAP